jgi:hypothetical protein
LQIARAVEDNENPDPDREIYMNFVCGLIEDVVLHS